MDAHVFLNGDNEWFISLRCAGIEVDTAGPFDDETDALLAAERCVYGDGSVHHRVAMVPAEVRAA